MLTFILLTFQVSFVRASPGFVLSDDSSKKVIFPLVPVQQSLCHCIAVPLLNLGNFMGYSTWCKFAVTQNVVQNVEHSLVSCDMLRLTLLTHAQSIGDQDPTGKQGIELCCSPRGVVLYGGCPERHPCRPGTL